MLSRSEMNRLRSEVDLEVAQTIGFSAAKEIMREIKENVLNVEAGGDRQALDINTNCIVTGNSGTGKTCVLFAKMLY